MGDALDVPTAGPAAIRGSALRAAAYGGGLVLALLSVPFLIRHLGIADFGRYTIVLSIIALVQGLTEAGLQSVGVREYTTRPPESRERLMRNLLGIRLVLTGSGIALAVGFAVVAGYDSTLVLGTALAGVGLMITVLQNLLTIPLAADLRYGWVSVADLARGIATVAFTLALVVASAELLPFLAISIPASLVAFAIVAWIVRGTVPLRPAFDRSDAWRLLRDTLAYAAAIALNVAYFRLTIVIMSLIATEIETGYFATSFRVLEVLLPVPALAIGAVFPIVARAARDDHARLAYASQRIFETGIILGAGITVVVVLGAPFALAVLAGDAGEPSVPVLRIQALAIVATFVAVGCGFSLLSLHRHRALLVANLAALVLSIGLTLALVPTLGARGAAVATASAEWVLALVSAALLARASPQLRPSPAIVAPVLIAAGAGLAWWLLPVPAVVQAVGGGTVFLLLLLALGRIPSELLDAVPRRRRSAA